MKQYAIQFALLWCVTFVILSCTKNDEHKDELHSDTDTDSDSDSDSDSDGDSDSDSDTDSDTDSDSDSDDDSSVVEDSNSLQQSDTSTQDIDTDTHTDTEIPDDSDFIDEVAYVFSSFTEDGEDGLHLIASDDGFSWEKVNDYISVYQQSSTLMRDPSVVYGPDGQYHMVWTTGWWEQNIAVAHSTDLRDWDEEILYVWADYTGPGTEESDGSAWPGESLTTPVPTNEYVRNSWAPEIFYDATTSEYVIYWSSTIDSPEVFATTWEAAGNNLNHRIYFITTRDFQTYTRRRLFYQPPNRVVIDAFVCKLGLNDYRMIIKDEATSGYGNLHICSSTKPLSSWADMPEDFWSDMSQAPFAGETVLPDLVKAEGPGGIQIGDDWYLYADYWMDGKTRVWQTDDFFDIQATEDFVFPSNLHLRHGTIFRAPKKDVDALLAL